MTYIYSTHRTLQEAVTALAELFATGEVREGERPTIVHRDPQRPENAGKAYAIVISNNQNILRLPLGG